MSDGTALGAGDLRFPTDWAEHDCPPADATDASGLTYRVIKDTTPVDDDFLTHHEKGVRRGPECLRRGLSVFQDLKAAEHCVDLFGQFGKHIARAELEPQHGKLKHTGNDKQPDHHTWWPYVGVRRTEMFVCVTQNA